MNSTLATSLASCFLNLKTPSLTTLPSLVRFTSTKPHTSPSIPTLKVKASSNNSNRINITLKSLTNTAIFLGVTASIIGRFSLLPAKAESPVTFTEQTSPILDQDQDQDQDQVSEFVEPNIDTLKSLLQQKLENGEDEEALNILKRLVSTQPRVTEWKFLMARLLNEMGQTQNARQVFEEILAINPLSFEALFENALLMDRIGEGEAVIRRLEEALTIAEEDNKVKEARDVRLIMAQIQFLHKNVEEALRSYEQLAKEDPSDFKPYFCLGMIYSLLGKNEEAKEMFANYRELSPKKFDVEGYLRTPLSRMKLFGTNEHN